MEVQDVEGVELSPEELEELLKNLPDILRELKLEYGHLD
jgi:seryl-tRNA synthetase